MIKSVPSVCDRLLERRSLTRCLEPCAPLNLIAEPGRRRATLDTAREIERRGFCRDRGIEFLCVRSHWRQSAFDCHRAGPRGIQRGRRQRFARYSATADPDSAVAARSRPASTDCGRSARRCQARSQRRMPRRAAIFLNQANRHPNSPGSTGRPARTDGHCVGMRRASTVTSSTARLAGAAGTTVMRPSVTTRHAARRGCSNIAFARSKISVTPTRTAPGPRLNNNRVVSLSSSAELGVLLVTLKVTIDEILPKERTSTDSFRELSRLECQTCQNR
jgi:hypothetical protein